MDGSELSGVWNGNSRKTPTVNNPVSYRTRSAGGVNSWNCPRLFQVPGHQVPDPATCPRIVAVPRGAALDCGAIGGPVATSAPIGPILHTTRSLYPDLLIAARRGADNRREEQQCDLEHPPAPCGQHGKRQRRPKQSPHDLPPPFRGQSRDHFFLTIVPPSHIVRRILCHPQFSAASGAPMITRPESPCLEMPCRRADGIVS